MDQDQTVMISDGVLNPSLNGILATTLFLEHPSTGGYGPGDRESLLA